MIFFNCIIFRFKSFFSFVLVLATTIVAHNNLLHFSERLNDTITLLSLFVLALSNPVASMMKERE